MAAGGLVMLVSAYIVAGHLTAIIDTSMFSQTYVWLVASVVWSFLVVGSGLLILSPIIAIGYYLIRRGVKFEDLKVKWSHVE